MNFTSRVVRGLGILAVTGLMIGVPGVSQAQSDSRTFPETGKTVSGQFLAYWTQHGGLAQQGFPISDEMQEKSDLNGQTYTVQYFERAVFEKHPENQPPFDTLLSQLGTFQYKAKYPQGAPGQTASADNARLFPETGKTLGGKFRAYWESHGALAQQGFPISDEFQEKSDLNGQTYTVQYFERAVFELHPENAGTPYEVLLSQLGTFQYKAKYGGGNPAATATPAATQAPAATATPAPSGDGCGDVPASTNMTVTPRCGPGGTRFEIVGTGFQPGEQVGRYYTAPNGSVVPGSSQSTADGNGNVSGISFITTANTPNGIWAGTFEGVSSHRKAVAFFRVGGSAAATATPPPSSGSCDISGTKDGSAVKTDLHPGEALIVRATGFTPGESVSYWFTLPTGDVFGTARPISGGVNPDGSIGPLNFGAIPAEFAQFPGVWALTFQGASSQHVSIIKFCVHP
jgi:hypothetical protein